MKSFVEQSERHYVSVPRHHLWSRIYIILRVSVFHIMCCVYVYVCTSVCSRVCGLFMCACLRVLRYSCVSSCFLTLVLTRVRLLSSFTHPFSPALSLMVLSHSVAYTRPHVLSARLSLPPYLTLSNIPRALSSLDLHSDTIACVFTAKLNFIPNKEAM